MYYTAAELVKKEAKTRVAILLHCAGPEAQDIHSNFVFSDTDGDRASDYNSVLKKFKEYCEPRKNEVFERYKFWQRDQHEGKTIDQWVNDLRILLGSCEYGDQKEKNLRDRIVFGVADTRVKERLLCESDLTLTKALDICHAAEASKVKLKTMSGEAKKGHDVHVIGKGKQKSRARRQIFSSIVVTISSSKRVRHKAGPNSPKKIASIVVKRIPRVNVPRMTLLAINAADRTTSQAYAKTANSVVSEKGTRPRPVRAEPVRKR